METSRTKLLFRSWFGDVKRPDKSLSRRVLVTAGTVMALSAASGAVLSNDAAAGGQGAQQSNLDTSQASVFEKVRNVIVQQLGVDPNKISMASEIMKDLGADSLDKVEITMALEEQFGVPIDDMDCEKIETVGDCVRVVQLKLRER